MPTPPTLLQVPPLQRTQPIITPNPPITAYPDCNNQSVPQHRYLSQASSAAPAVPNIPQNFSNGENLRQRTLDSYPKKPRPETTRLLPQNNLTSSYSMNKDLRNNPCQPSNIVGGRLNSHVSNIDSAIQQRQPLPPPPMQNNRNITSMNSYPPHSTTNRSPKPLQQPMQTNPYASLRQAASSSTIGDSNIGNAMPSSFTSNPSFSELKSILQTLLTDRALYEQYYGKVITVPCKMNNSGHDKEFNIVKSSQDGAGSSSAEKKKSKSKKEKKYEFLLVGKFFGPKQSDGAIACRVDSSVLEPYFNGHSPVS